MIIPNRLVSFFKRCPAETRQSEASAEAPTLNDRYLVSPSLPRRFPKIPIICQAGAIDGNASGECYLAGHQLAYGVQVGFQMAGTEEIQVNIRGWALDIQAFTACATLVCCDAEGNETRLSPEMPRGDIMNHLQVPKTERTQAGRCGYEGNIGTKTPFVEITLEVDGMRHVIGTGRPSPAQFLEGQHGWLFLAGDSNDSPSQFTQKHYATSDWIEEWARYFTALKALGARGSAGKVSFIIAPSKESIFPDYYPLPHGGHSPLDSLLDRFGEEPDIHYPIEALVPMRELSYDRAETHWTDFGARLVCEMLLTEWNKNKPNIPYLFELPKGSGDLGIKAVPPHFTHRTKAAWPNASKIIFDNFVLHHGRVRVHANPEPRINAKVVIFGGSSAEYMERYLTAVFARVVYVYSAGAWDHEILAHEKPDFTILQTSERFLTRAPVPEVENRNIVRKKVTGNLITLRSGRDTALEAFDDPTVRLYRSFG